MAERQSSALIRLLDNAQVRQVVSATRLAAHHAAPIAQPVVNVPQPCMAGCESVAVASVLRYGSALAPRAP